VVSALLAFAALAIGPRPAAALPPDVFQSVVSVLPHWPDRPDDPDEPEGSGVAVLAGGYVATNVHVLGRAREVSVRLADGRVLPARIVGRDPPTDIALLQIEADLPVRPTLPDPDLAQPVCAIGNQFGLGLSVTCGVVSAVHRTGTGFNPIEDFVQTDATVNPGGSGGALVDLEGRLVGLVSAIFTKRSDADIGVNFAASVPLLMRVVEDLKAHGRVGRGRPGLRVEALDRAERAERVGARVVQVSPDGAAQRAGLALGDLIVQIGNRAIREPDDVPSAIHLFAIGAHFSVTYVRDGVGATVDMVMDR